MKITIIDSGIHAGRPHAVRIAGGAQITATGENDDILDRLGHGTAVAGAIRQKAPDAELYAVKVLDRRLTANIDMIIRALEWCRGHAMDLVNLSLGTKPPHRERFLSAIADDLLVVSPAGALPGSLQMVIGVAADPDCPRDSFRYHDGMFHTSPYPPAIPGVPLDRNQHGTSFAVANMTGFVARALESSGRAKIREVLIAGGA